MLNVSKLGSRERKRRGFLLEKRHWLDIQYDLLFVHITNNENAGKKKNKQKATENGNWRKKKIA